MLNAMAINPGSVYSINHLREILGGDATLWQNFTQTAFADGFIKSFSNLRVPTPDCDVYCITPQGVNFILHQGGYARKRRFQNYADTNIRFTWMRHWIWFYSAILSILGNIYFIATYLWQ